MKFSVVISVLNADNNFENCIKSVYNQFDNKNEFEVMLISDKSINNNIFNMYKDINIISLENYNLNKLKNEAIKHSKGEYLVFINSYEYLDKNALKIYYNECVNQNLDVLDTDFKTLVNSTGYKYGFFSRKRYIIQDVIDGKLFYKYVLSKEACFNTDLSRYVYKRQFLLDNELFFDEKNGDECYIFITNSILNAEKIKYINTNLLIKLNNNYNKYNIELELLNIIFLVESLNFSGNIGFYDEIIRILYKILSFIDNNKELYTYIDKLKNILKSIDNNLLNINENLELEIIINNFRLYDKIRKSSIDNFNSRFLNNIYLLNKIINNESKNYLDDNTYLQIENFFNKNNLYNRFLSYDSIQELLKKYKEGQKIEFNLFCKYIKLLQRDLYVCIDDRIEGYFDFEDKVFEIILDERK